MMLREGMGEKGIGWVRLGLDINYEERAGEGKEEEGREEEGR
jgi:hypothetical protein